jgi:uncharacterized protein (UPF0333 family)
MKKLGFIVLAVVLAVGLVGVGYAAFAPTSVSIQANVATGTLTATIQPNGPATLNDYMVLKNEPSAPGSTLSVTVTNASPGAVITVPYMITNTGSFPCVVSWGANEGSGYFSYADSGATSVVSRKQLYNQKSCLKLFGRTYARQKVWGQSWLQSGILQWP